MFKTYTVYAVRQSSKGWSDIICVAATHEAAEKLVARFYEDERTTNEARVARGCSSIHTNYRIEEITYFQYFRQ